MSEINGNRQMKSGTSKAKEVPAFAKVSIGTSVLNLIRTTWNPQPIPVPAINPDLEVLPAIERIAEVLRYQLLQIEYGLSNRGGLREWMRLVAVLTLVLAIPAVLIVPLVTVFLYAAASWTALLFQITQYLLYALLTAAACVIVVLAAEQGLRWYWKWRREQREKN
jgi:small-conductance mechanosensitive channel